MLSRGTSNASHGPQRAKSTSSIIYEAAVSRGIGVADTGSAHQDALTAASLAYQRANQHHIAPKGILQIEKEDPQKDMEDPPGLMRRQSIRFVGPNAIPTRTRPIKNREAPGDGSSNECHRQSFPMIPMKHPACPSETSITALSLDFNEDYVASEPSSYRKLRKAKSMLIPGKIASTVFADRTPKIKTCLERRSERSLGDNCGLKEEPGPRLQRSHSFIRGVPDRISTGSRRYATQDTAIQLARDTFLKQVEQQRLKSQPSFFGLGKRQKTQKAFRKTVRTSSTNSYGSAVSSPLPSVEPGAPKGLGYKARDFSQSWKEKFKRVFKRSLIDGSAIPVQHLDSSQPHYGNIPLTPQDSVLENAFPRVYEPITEYPRRIDSRESSLHCKADYGDNVPYPYSIRSVGSDDEDTRDKSRVTSWTNSTATNTINMPLLMKQKRLSVIQEDGGLPRYSSPIQHDRNTSKSLANPLYPVGNDGAGRLEAQRIFSALRRQIDKNNHTAELDASEASADDNSDQRQEHQSFSIPRKRSRSGASNKCIEYAHIPNAHHSNLNASGLVIKGDTQHPSSTDQNEIELCDSLTPQQVAVMNENGISLSRRPLREVRSTFFPPSMHIGRNNVSPFRRAMHANRKDGDAAIRSDSADQRATVISGSVAGSESVYSHSSDGHDWKPNASSASLTKAEEGQKDGDAAIITNSTSAHGLLARSSPLPIHSSKQSGNTTQKVSSSQLSPIASDRRLHHQKSDELFAKHRCHKKEDAQIDRDDVEIGCPQACKSTAEQPLRSLHDIIRGHPHSTVRGTILKGAPIFAQTITNKQDENSPFRSSSESSQRRSNLKNEESLSGFWNDGPGTLRQKTSYASLMSQGDSQWTSFTMDSKYSSERTERLRRLKSSSVTALQQTQPQHENRQAQNQSSSPKRKGQPLTEAGMNTKLVNGFLKDRRRDMRISEESSTDPVFL